MMGIPRRGPVGRGRGITIGRSAATVVTAILLGALALFGVGAFDPEPAHAFKPPKTRPPTTDEVRAFKYLQRLTHQGGTESVKTRARQVMTRGIVQGAPRAGGALLASGGAAVVGAGAAAGGVWTVVGLELYYLPCWECSSEAIQTGVQVRLPAGAAAAYYDDVNGQYTQAWITHASAYRDPLTYEVTRVVYGHGNVVKWWRYTNSGGTGWNADFPAITQAPSSFTTLRFYPQPQVPTYQRSFHATSKFQSGHPVYVNIVGRVPGVGGRSSQQLWQLCPAAPGACVGRDFPSVEIGGMGASMPNGGPVKLMPEEGNAVIAAVVADPETKRLIEEPSAEPFPPGFPTDPFVDPYENADADPDGDGTPNRTDQDPEGDADPDGDGDHNEHPPLAPWPANPDSDGDGIPDKTDPDDDNDGYPDERDPRPVVWDPKPWLDPGFRASSDPQEREALWGPVVQRWTMTEGRDCKEYEYVTVVCDYPDGHAYVLVEKDWAEWFQYAGGEKDWFFKPQDKPNPAPTPTLTRDRRNDVPAVFYRGQTLYDALRVEQEGFDAEVLKQRQSGRQLTSGPGLYTSRNREVALSFGKYNVEFHAGQGGLTLMTIVLRQKDFNEMVAKYGVLDNVPTDPPYPGVPLPHVETVFLYESLPELNVKMRPPSGALLVEQVPMQ